MKLAFDEEGDGPLVVLLHGFPEDRRAWRHQIPALARAGFRVVAPDLRGYGDSPKPRDVDSYRVQELVGDVAELIESLCDGSSGPRFLGSSGDSLPPRNRGPEEPRNPPQQCFLVGHDWGAVLAWFVTMMRPDLVRRLAILNVPHPAAFSRELRRSRSQRLRAAYQLFFQLPVLPEIAWRLFGGMLMRRMTGRRYSWPGPLRPMFHYYRALRRTRGQLRKLITRIEIPVLLIWGEEQSIFIEETLHDLDGWIADLHIERIAHARHFVQHDAPDKVNQVLVSFVSS